MNGFRFLVITFAVLLAAVASLSLHHNPDQTATAAAPTPLSTAPPVSVANEPSAPRQTEPPPTMVSAGEYYRAYQANELSADKRFKGRRLGMTGPIGEIAAPPIGDGGIVRFGNSFQAIDAYFDRSWVDTLAQLHKGAVITVVCTGAGMTLDRPQLNNCELAPTPTPPAPPAVSADFEQGVGYRADNIDVTIRTAMSADQAERTVRSYLDKAIKQYGDRDINASASKPNGDPILFTGGHRFLIFDSTTGRVVESDQMRFADRQIIDSSSGSYGR